MNRFRLIVNPFAEHDLKISKKWYDLQKGNLGTEFILEVENTIQSILSNPFQFTKIKGEIRRALIKRFPFGIYYFVKGDIINVFAVFHFNRNPKIWKSRI